MFVYRKSDDFEPVAWLGGYPLYATTLLVGLHLLAMAGGALLFAFHHGGWMAPFAFSSTDVLEHGKLWQWATYAWVHSPSDAFGFAIGMFLLYAFGREVERYLGRRDFLLLYGSLVLVPPILLTLAGFFTPTGWIGSRDVHFAVFLSFAILYPGVELIFRITARWIAWGLLAVYTLTALASNQWVGLSVLWVDAATAFCFIAILRGTLSLPRFPGFGEKPEQAQSKSGPPGSEPSARFNSPHGDPMEAIDPLLDKIAREGIASLTPQERQRLERAREELLGKARR